VHELVIPGRTTIIPFLPRTTTAVAPSVGSCGKKNLRIITVPGFLNQKDLYRRSKYKNFKYDNVIKMKNKPDPSLLEAFLSIP
jgi:hypothetical protein